VADLRRRGVRLGFKVDILPTLFLVAVVDLRRRGVRPFGVRLHSSPCLRSYPLIGLRAETSSEFRGGFSSSERCRLKLLSRW